MIDIGWYHLWSLTCNQRLAARRQQHDHCEREAVFYLLVCKPTEAAHSKKLPLIPAHANILDGSVNDLCFACIYNLALPLLIDTDKKKDCYGATS